MKNKINLTLILAIGFSLVIGCAKSNSDSERPMPKPQSFSSTPANSNYYNFANQNAASTVKSKAKKKVAKKSETSSETQYSSSEVEKPLTAKPRSDDGYYHLGPRGGCFYYTASGRKEYVDRGLCH